MWDIVGAVVRAMSEAEEKRRREYLASLTRWQRFRYHALRVRWRVEDYFSNLWDALCGRERW